MLFGATALPQVVCASHGNDTHCAAQMDPSTATHESCHESQTPTESLSCCDHTALQTSTPATTVVAPNSFSVVMSDVATVVPATEESRQVFETKILQSHSPPLFTLFSVFLI